MLHSISAILETNYTRTFTDVLINIESQIVVSPFFFLKPMQSQSFANLVAYFPPLPLAPLPLAVEWLDSSASKYATPG